MLGAPALEASFDATSEQFTVRTTDRRQPRELHHARQRIIRAAATEGDPANTGRAPHGHNSTAVWLRHPVHFVSDGIVARLQQANRRRPKARRDRSDVNIMLEVLKRSLINGVQIHLIPVLFGEDPGGAVAHQRQQPGGQRGRADEVDRQGRLIAVRVAG